MMRRLLTVSPDNESLRVRLYVQPYGNGGPPCSWAMLFPHPTRTPWTGLAFFRRNA